MNNFSIFGLTSSTKLAAQISDILGKPQGKIILKQFSDGEWYIEYDENIRNRHVILVQSTNAPVDNLLTLCMAARAARGASAADVTAVIPYFGYARQERTSEKRTLVTARLVADILALSGVDRFLLLDLHKGSIEGFFDPQRCKIDHLYARKPMIQAIERVFVDDIASGRLMLASADTGGVDMVRSYANRFSHPLPFVVINKNKHGGVIKDMSLVGDVRDKRVLIVDDIGDTLSTGFSAARLLLENGAIDVSISVVHAVLSGHALANLANPSLARFAHVFVSDSIERDLRHIPQVITVSVAPLLAEAIRRSLDGRSLRELME